MILVDTSVWIDHLRRRNAALSALLDNARVTCHPFVIGEMALGRLANRTEILRLLSELPSARVVRHEDAMALIEARGLAGAGIGWVDVHLLASALVEQLPVFTLDSRLAAVAEELSVGWSKGAR